MTTETPPAGRLERRKARTRASIIEAAAALFHQRGYEETSIQHIAELADTGVGTLYGYFDSKDEILREVLLLARNEALEGYLAAIDEQTPTIDRICTALRQVGVWVRNNRTILIAAFQISARQRPLDEEQAVWVYNAFATMLHEGIASGELRKVPVDTTVRMLLGAYTTAMLGLAAWKGREDDPKTLADLDLLTRGMLVGA